MSLPSKSSTDTDSGDPVEIVIDSARPGGAELALYDASYALVAECASPLCAEVAPGKYRVRVGTGSASLVEEIVVPEGADVKHFYVGWPLLEKPAREAGNAEWRALRASFRATWSRGSHESSGIVIAVRHDKDADQARLHAAFIESHTLLSQDGQELLGPSETIAMPEEGITILFTPAKLHAVLSQRLPDRKRSMTVPVFRGCITHVILPQPPVNNADVDLTTRFDRAVVSAIPHTPDAFELMLRQQAAGQAIRAGHYVTGWVIEGLHPADEVARRAPLLALFELAGASVRTPSMQQRERAFALLRGADAGTVTPLVDLEALAYGLHDHENAAGIAAPLEFDVPPLLARSWRLLVARWGAREASRRYLPADALVDTSGPWMSWTVPVERPKIKEYVGPGTGYVIIDNAAQGAQLERLRDALGQTRLLSGRKTLSPFARRGETRGLSRPGTPTSTTRPVTSRALVSFEQVREWLVMLADSGELRTVLEEIYARSRSDKSETVDETLFRHFLTALDPLVDQFLLATFGTRDLVSHILDGLSISPERIAEQFVSLFARIDRRIDTRPPVTAIERRVASHHAQVPTTIHKIQFQLDRAVESQRRAVTTNTVWIPKA